MPRGVKRPGTVHKHHPNPRLCKRLITISTISCISTYCSYNPRISNLIKRLAFQVHGVLIVPKHNIDGSRLVCYVIELLTRSGVRATNSTSFGALLFASSIPLIKTTHHTLRTYSINTATRLISSAAVASLLGSHIRD